MNKIIIKGRLTRDPEMKTGASGVEFCKFTVAVDRKLSKDKMKDKSADFFDCTAFGKTGAAIHAFIKKGREILVEGRMESSTSEKDGQKRTFWGIVVETFDFCGSKGDSQAPASAPEDASGFTPVETEELPF
jgi:single-strand DNA-binding protein